MYMYNLHCFQIRMNYFNAYLLIIAVNIIQLSLSCHWHSLVFSQNLHLFIISRLHVRQLLFFECYIDQLLIICTTLRITNFGKNWWNHFHKTPALNYHKCSFLTLVLIHFLFVCKRSSMTVVAYGIAKLPWNLSHIYSYFNWQCRIFKPRPYMTNQKVVWVAVNLLWRCCNFTVIIGMGWVKVS